MLRESRTKQLTVAKEDWISSVRHAEQLQDFHSEIAQDELTQRITINLGDESDDSELSGMEGEEDNSDGPLAVPLSCFVLLYQDAGNSYHRSENKNKVRLHESVLNRLLNATCS
jgi:hypothetical protein